MVILGRGKLCGQYKVCMASVLNAYLTGIRIVKHEKVFCRFHLENQAKQGINLMLTRSAIRISDNPLSSPLFASFVLRLLRIT